MKDGILSLTVEKYQLTVYNVLDTDPSRHKKYTKSDREIANKHGGLK